MDNNSIRIDMYLLHEMSAAEKIAFENELKTNTALQQEVALQKQIMEAAKNAGIKNEFSKAIKSKIIKGKMLKAAVAVVLVAALALVAYKNDLFCHKNGGVKKEEISNHINADTFRNSNASDSITDSLKNVQMHNDVNNNKTISETFNISNATDTIIETKDGVVFAIPANAFNGTNNIKLQIKTALTPFDIMQNGLSTLSNGALLQTAGMFYIKGFSNGNAVQLTKEISVSVPTNKINPAMQLFDGVQDSTGKINWVNPKPIEHKLRTYDITTLDFYPTKYIPTLKAFNKRYKNKKYTDSLYYSFSGYGNKISLEISKPVKENDYPVDTILKSESTDGNAIPQKPDEGFNFHYEIDPSKIRAIWDKKFNNTNLATKEFEERLRFLHTLCEPIYLNAYIEAIDKPLYKIDQLCANYASGEIRKKFLEFAARKDGRIAIANGLQQKLSTYFQEKAKAYQEATEKTWANYQQELQALNNIADFKKYENAVKNTKSKLQNYEEEFCANLTEAYSQIGVKRNCRDTPPPAPAPKYYTVPITNTGWKNLDAYVMEATAARKSMTYTDPATGKTAQLKYEGITIKIENETQFDRVMVYLIPNGLSSFQKIENKENSYKENLNSIFKYDAVILAYKGEQAYFISVSNVLPKEYLFTLLPKSNAEVLKSLDNYSLDKAKNMKTEFEYRLFEQKEALRQIQLQKDEAFREVVGRSIFNCFRDFNK
jgi:hypothetical protein